MSWFNLSDNCPRITVRLDFLKTFLKRFIYIYLLNEWFDMGNIILVQKLGL